MKLKIKEQTDIVVPYYITVGEFDTPFMGLTIKNIFKYVNLPTVLLPIVDVGFTKIYSNSLPVSFYTNMKKYADMYISDLYILTGPRANTVWGAPGTYLDYRYYGVYAPKPTPRLTPWFAALYYPKPTIFSILNGLTAIAGACATTTYNEYGIFNSFNTKYGVLTTGSDVETTLINFKDGITGGKNLIKRPYSFNDIKTFGYYDVVSHPMWTYCGRPQLLLNSTAWALPKNKLLAVLEDVDQRHCLCVLEYLTKMAVAWKYQREIYSNNSGITPNLKTQEQLDALNTDILDNLKIILNEWKTHYPLARPRNGTSSTSTTLWAADTSASWPAGLCGPGVRQTPVPLGATFDYMVAEGITYNTWSPKGWERDQGMYLFDGWGLRTLLNMMYHITDAPVNINPLKTKNQLLNDDEWGEILNDVRILMTKEVFDGVKHLEEGRPWYSKRKYWDDGTLKDGYIWPSKTYPDGTNWANTKPPYQNYKYGGGYFYPDPDNRGYITSNQNVTPISDRIEATMYLYPYARTKEQKQGLLAAYNMFTEIWAAILERFVYGVTDPEQCGNWPEGWAYASQSMPDFLKVLDITKRIGDRRLWDTYNTPDYFNPTVKGVPYKSWANNSWKWVISRIMPNNLIINYGSTNTFGWEVPGNAYQFYPYSILLQAALISEFPEPGKTGSAIAELYDWFDAVDTGDPFVLQFFNTVKEYKKGTIWGKTIPKGYYTQTERVFVWKSEPVIPKFHSDWLFGTNSALKNNLSKPLIFAIWGKGVGTHEEKVNQDGSHISAYLGDAILLMETGELRALWEGSGGTDATYTYHKTDMYRAKGHNKMQLGERKDPASPQPIEWTNIVFGETGGYAFTDATPVYNRQGLTGTAYGWAPSEGYLWQTNDPTFHVQRNGDPKFYISHPSFLVPYTQPDGKYAFEPYQYQIKKCTRGVTWGYTNRTAKIQIEDIVGISAMNNLYPGASWYATGPYATGPDTRVYYKFHVGYTGADFANVFPLPKEGTDTGITYYAIAGTNNTEWKVEWQQPIPYNVSAGMTCDIVGVTMTFVGSQPIRLERELTLNHTFKYSPNVVPGIGATPPARHYAINVLLGKSGASYFDEMNLQLNTTVDAVAKLKT